jgi:hypothetical protein
MLIAVLKIRQVQGSVFLGLGHVFSPPRLACLLKHPNLEKWEPSLSILTHVTRLHMKRGRPAIQTVALTVFNKKGLRERPFRLAIQRKSGTCEPEASHGPILTLGLSPVKDTMAGNPTTPQRLSGSGVANPSQSRTPRPVLRKKKLGPAPSFLLAPSRDRMPPCWPHAGLSC